MNTTPTRTARPSRHGSLVLTLAATKLMARLKESRPDVFDPSNGWSDDETRAQLAEAIGSSWHGDGYEIAKALEHNGWDVDTQLVNELDGGCLEEAFEEVIESWIAECGIAPALAVGTTVTVNPNIAKGREARADGQITDIDIRRGTYTVCVPAWGHVKAGLGTHGRIWPWEEVEGWQNATEPAK